MLLQVENVRNQNCIMDVGNEADKKDVVVNILQVVICYITKVVTRNVEVLDGN